jgi:hypothetical protein
MADEGADPSGFLTCQVAGIVVEYVDLRQGQGCPKSEDQISNGRLLVIAGNDHGDLRSMHGRSDLRCTVECVVDVPGAKVRLVPALQDRISHETRLGGLG